MPRWMTHLIFFSCISITSFVVAAQKESPHGTVHSHNPEKFVNQIKNKADAGKKVYDLFCSTCHAEDPQIEINAPRFHNKKEWLIRRKKGIPGMLQITKMGLNSMPPRGGCFECSDKMLQAAIVYMLPNKKKLTFKK